MKNSRFLTAALLVLCVVCRAGAADWYNWRGPFQNGFSPETDLPASWDPDPKKPENLVWRAPYGCRSTPLVMNGRVFLINHTSKNGIAETIQERVMCLDADTGKFLWEHNFNVFHTDIVTSRLGWTNLAGDPTTGNVYAHGTQGLFFCFDRNGKVLWSKSLTEEYGRISGYGGRVTSPIVADKLVIIGMLNSAWGENARGGNRFLAMDKMTGEVVWWSEPGGQPKGTYYSVPVVATIGNQALLISGAADGSVYAMKLHTGEKVWGYNFGSLAINSSPVVDGNLVYIGHGEENPDNNEKGRIICLDASDVTDGKPKLVWKKDGIKVRYTTPIVHAGKVYLEDEVGKMYCFDAKTGDSCWKKPLHFSRGGQGSPVLADGKIYVSETASQFFILQPGENACKKLHTFTFPGGEEANGTPAVANGRVYFSTSEDIYCIGKKGAKPAPEPPIWAGPNQVLKKIGALQIFPADVVAYPGDTLTFKVRTFDVNGNYIGEMPPKNCTWTLPMPAKPPTAKAQPPALDGTLADGSLVIGKTKPTQQGSVQASLGGLTARARVRVLPNLPYAPNFDKLPDGSVPAGWVNTQGKFFIKSLKDGHKVLAKVNTNPSPLIARANAFMGMPTMKDYTIESDVFGTKVGADAPDMGIVANRYTLVIAGGLDKLRIVSWDVLPRIDKTIPFAWKPQVWYRLKLTVIPKGDTAVVMGKAWERDQPEPAAWTLSVEDPRPNYEGSPALYGFVQGATDVAPGTEIFFDNLRITPNNNKK